ncbi:hypothetical protein KDM87_04335 [Undibacterium sp. FT147W]|uniref:ATP-grasp domain-containing protein n=1 Tax=Undibacterium rivi TaxID=2828729 RepID=A0ABS5H1H8_9BURK|nr:DUF6348 family protein [Undibacterium rivi]MBR7791814.1 hypothetical protein [Undibacterium rivi]
MSLLQSLKNFTNKFSSGAHAAASVTSPVLTPQMQSDPLLTEVLAVALSDAGIAFERLPSCIQLAEGLALAVQPVTTNVVGEGRVRTCTRIHAWHPQYFPQGIAEYQHALGADEAAAIAEGFAQWIKMDLVVLLDATRDVPRDCTVIEMNVANGAETTEASEHAGLSRFRQVILGPVAHLASNPPPKNKEAHPFCPCCLFTESMEAFHDVLQTDQFLGVRLFASRDQLGVAAADCRVNGEDFPAALPALTAYVEKWPQRGLEFRKQYVVIRTVSRVVDASAVPVNSADVSN